MNAGFVPQAAAADPIGFTGSLRLRISRHKAPHKAQHVLCAKSLRPSSCRFPAKG